MRSQCLLSVLVLCVIWRQCSAATNCYACSSTIDKDGVEKEVTSPATGVSSCVTPPEAAAVTTGGEYGCTTTFTSSGDSATIVRGPSDKWSNKTENECTTSEFSLSGSSESSTKCTCNTDKCNSNALAAARTYDCYKCMSSGYFDNGCGEKLNSASKYVRTIKGCSACYKNVQVNTDHTVTYTRGCARSVHIDDTCGGDENESGGRTCGCEKSLCNSAETVALKSVTAFTAIILSAAFKLMC